MQPLREYSQLYFVKSENGNNLSHLYINVMYTVFCVSKDSRKREAIALLTTALNLPLIALAILCEQLQVCT